MIIKKYESITLNLKLTLTGELNEKLMNFKEFLAESTGEDFTEAQIFVGAFARLVENSKEFKSFLKNANSKSNEHDCDSTPREWN